MEAINGPKSNSIQYYPCQLKCKYIGTHTHPVALPGLFRGGGYIRDTRLLPAFTGGPGGSPRPKEKISQVSLQKQRKITNLVRIIIIF